MQSKALKYELYFETEGTLLFDGHAILQQLLKKINQNEPKNKDFCTQILKYELHNSISYVLRTKKEYFFCYFFIGSVLTVTFFAIFCDKLFSISFLLYICL